MHNRNALLSAYRLLSLLCLLLTGSYQSMAQVTNTVNTNATQLAQTIAGQGITVTNATLVCGPKRSARFTSTVAALGIAEGIVLSTSDMPAGTLLNPEASTPGYPPLEVISVLSDQSFDACRLEFDLTAATPELTFNYVFGSDEYPTYIDQAFNDAFAFFISGPGIAGQQNLATIPGTNVPITISTINAADYPQFFTNYQRAGATGVAGTTKVLTAKAVVTPCETYHLILAIADMEDAALRSSVWIQKSSLVSGGVEQVTPSVSGTLGNGRIYENCDSATFTFNVPQALSYDYNIKLKIKGTATNGVDYRLITDSLVIPTGQTSTFLRIVPIEDGILDPGETVEICIIDPCSGAELGCRSITIEELMATISPDVTICKGDVTPLTVTNNPNYNYSWSPSNSLSCGNCFNPMASPSDSTEYTVTVSDNGCSLQRKVKVKVNKSFAGDDGLLTVCENGAAVDLFTRITNAPAGGTRKWIAPNGTPFTNPYNPPVHTPGDYLFLASQNGCPDDTAKVNVKEILLPNAGIDGAITVCNTEKMLQLFPLLTGSPETTGSWFSTPANAGLSATGVFDASKVAAGIYNLKYRVNGTTPCPNDTAQVVVTVKQLPVASFVPLGPICANSNQQLTVNINGGVAPYDVEYLVDGVTFTETVNGNSFTIPVNINTNTIYQITSVADQGMPVCKNDSIKTTTVAVSVPPVLSLDSNSCNNTSTGYTAYFTMSGGHAPSYTINGNPVTGNKFISSLLPAGSSNTFVLTDRNGCLPQSTVTVVKSCNCLSDAGTLAQTIIEVCGSTPATAAPNADTFVDGNDKVVFVLHDNPGTSLGTVYETSLTPTFTYNPAWGIVYGNTYYITRVVGDASATMPNFVDFSNPNGCMDVAVGQPVVFHEIPAATGQLNPTQICRGQSTELVMNFTAGKPGYTVLFNDGTSNFTANSLSNASNKYTITPTTIGNLTYTLTQVSDTNGCVAPLNIRLDLIVVDRPDTSARVITCNSTNTAYTVSFNISQGDAPSYTINGVAATSNFTSTFINSGSSYSFTVNDINNCLPLTVAGSHTCPCVTDAGDMSAVPVVAAEFCITSPAVAAHNGTKTLDGNDALSFILCSNPASPVTSLIQHSKTPSFNFNAATMTTGTVYYIVPIAGDSTPSGLYDVNATACFNSGNAYPVRFLEVPTVRAIGAFEICDGQTVVVNYTITGDASKMIDFTLNRPDGTAINHSFAPGNRTSAALTPVYSFAINDSIKYNVLAASIRYAGSPACAGNLLGDSVRIKINPTPSATLAGSFIICQGESIDIPYTTSGNGNITTNFSGNGLAVASKTLPAGSHTFTVAPTSAGVFAYNITSVSSNTGSGACTGAAVGPFTVTVRATPSANISVTNPIICLNQSTQVQLQGTGFYSLRAYYHDNNNVKFSQVLANGNVTLAGNLLSPTADAIYTLDSVVDATVSNKSMRSCFINYNSNNTASVRVNPLPKGRMEGSTEICRDFSAPLTFTFSENAPYTFRYSDGTSSYGPFTVYKNDTVIQQSPKQNTTYRLESVVDRNGCSAINLNDFELIVVNPIPQPDFTATVFESCPPLETVFINLTDSSLAGTCLWTFGDGTTANGCGDQPKTYLNDQSYNVSLQVMSPQGCVGITKVGFVTVHPFPQANFYWDPQVPNNLSNSVVQFYNQSAGGSTYNWEIINNQGQSIEQSTAYNPSYDFASDDSATYQVKLLTTTEFGCQDSIEKRLRVTGELIVFAPNSFTPNGDGENDIFLPIMNGFVPVSYEMLVFDRWGELVFSTTDFRAGWDGVFQGAKAKTDTYSYKIRVRSKYSAEKRDVTGFVHLLR